MGKIVDIPAGKTVDVHFSFIPESAGNYTLSLYTGRDKDGNVSGTKIGTEKPITIAESDATDDLDLTFAADVENLTSDGKMYGNAMRATVTVTNNSSEYSYAGELACIVYKWTTEDNKPKGTSVGYTLYPLVVEKGNDKSTIVHVAHDGLESGARYSARLKYKRGNNYITGLDFGFDEDEKTGTLIATEGYSVGDAEGNKDLYAPSTEIDLSSEKTSNACYVDLRDLGTLDGVSITIGSNPNPNCLYLLADGANIPSTLEDCNVVRGNTATSLKLQDGADFYSPISFTATNASYTRTFNDAAAGTSGWSSLFLPFKVTSITCEDLGIVDWFHSSTDENKDFWLRSFTADGESSVTFDYAQEIAANTPYIIAVPGEDFGAWKMTGKAVTFSGTNVSIVPTGTASASGDHYKFCGSSVGSELKDVYMLNAKGSKFVKKTTSTPVPAFRGWFSPVSISSLSHTSLSIVGPETTGIKTIVTDENAGNGTGWWYSIDGRRLTAAPSAPGIYINNGKKIVIK